MKRNSDLATTCEAPIENDRNEYGRGHYGSAMSSGTSYNGCNPLANQRESEGGRASPEGSDTVITLLDERSISSSRITNSGDLENIHTSRLRNTLMSLRASLN